jgi:predicted Zn-dependent protease
MKLVTPTFFKRMAALVWLVLAMTSIVTPVFADDYDDVRQLMRSGKLTEATSKVDQFLANRPRDPQMQFLKGVLQRDTQKTTEAIATFTRLTQDYPELPEPYNNLAVLYAGQNQYDKARAALDMAIRNNPSYATAHENLGDVYEKAVQLEAGNSSIPRKLALTRELLNPTPKETKQTEIQKKE